MILASDSGKVHDRKIAHEQEAAAVGNRFGFNLRCLNRVQVLLGLVLSLAWISSAQPTGAFVTNDHSVESGFALTLHNRQIFVFRSTLDNYSAEERQAAAAARLHSVLSKARTMLVTTQTVASGVQISLDGKSLFIITPGDISGLRGETVDSEAANVAASLGKALHERNSLSSPRELMMAVGRAALGFGLFAALVWAVRRVKRWLLTRSTQVAADKTENVSSRELRTAGLRSFVTILRSMLNFVSYLFIAFLAFALLWHELRCFPYSKPWGDFLRARAFSVLEGLGHGILGALPGLTVVVLIVLVARMLAQVLSRLFAAAESGEIELHRLNPATAKTTRRILTVLVWVIAAVVSYPYIPGSQSLAFKGVTVFAGLLISLGSSNLINQIGSGLLLIYTHAFQVGDYVRVGEIEGTVLGVGMCVTRIRTIQNEEVHIANSVLLGTATKNYTHLAKSDGLFLPVKVTISYSTSWRQVHAMLLEAAKRTAGLAAEPQPFVLQTSLSDFYVEYELNTCLERPERRVWVQSDLHSHIQDVFNEHGVQIMSPHYLQDPPKPHLVPKSKWFLPMVVDGSANEALSPESNPSKTIRPS